MSEPTPGTELSPAAPEPPDADTSAANTPAAGPATDGWRRLSPRMLLVHPVQEVVRAFPALIVLLVAGTSTGGGPWWTLAGLGAMIVLGLLRWFTTTYRITDDQVQVQRGLIRRRLLTVPRDRVRTVDVTAHILHRALGLARVTIGTGRSDKKNDGLRLDALTATAADALRVELLRRDPAAATAPAKGRTTARRRPARPAEEQERELARMRPSWLRFGPFTLSGVIAVGVVAGFTARIVSEAHIRVSQIGAVREGAAQIRHTPMWVIVLLAILVCLLIVTIAAELGYLLSFWNFRLTRQPGGTLHVSRGLVTSRKTTIEERRLHGAEISEPLLLRAVRGGRCIAIATGLRVGRGAERGGSMLLPPAPRTEVDRVAGEVLGSTDPVHATLRPHGPRARRRRYTRALTFVAVPILALLALWAWAGWPSWAWQLSLILVPIAVGLAFDRFRGLGHTVVDGILVSRLGSLVRRRSMLSVDGVIGWNLRRSFFQRRAGLATLSATTAAGRQHYPVPDLPLPEAVRLAEEAVPGLLTPFLTNNPEPTTDP